MAKTLTPSLSIIAGNVADVKRIIDVVVREAKAGEPSAVTELLERLWVVPRSRLVKFPMPLLASVNLSAG
jgi:hypothetical protein